MKIICLQSFVLPIPTASNLERIVISRAVGSSILSSMSSEWSVDKFIFDIINFHTDNWWLFSIILAYAYIYYKLMQMINLRLIDVPAYDRWSRTIEDGLFIFFLVFSRDVQNAI